MTRHRHGPQGGPLAAEDAKFELEVIREEKRHQRRAVDRLVSAQTHGAPDDMRPLVSRALEEWSRAYVQAEGSDPAQFSGWPWRALAAKLARDRRREGPQLTGTAQKISAALEGLWSPAADALYIRFLGRGSIVERAAELQLDKRDFYRATDVGLAYLTGRLSMMAQGRAEALEQRE
jgi:hypothetical protein